MYVSRPSIQAKNPFIVEQNGYNQKSAINNGVKNAITVNELNREPNATGVLSDYKDSTDPKYIGPGTWNVIHRNAFRSRTHAQQLEFIDFMKEVCKGFPCVVCQGHCSEYIRNHPMEDYLDISVDINGDKLELGLFVWTWKFHNAVNARIKKPIMSWDTAYNLYADTESLVCSKNCMEADNQPPDGLEHMTDDKNKTKVPNIPEINTSQPFRLISMNRK